MSVDAFTLCSVAAMIELLASTHDDGIKRRAADGQTALHHAMACGHTVTVDALLARGAQIGARDARQRSPLAMAVQAGSAPGVLLAFERGATLAACDTGCVRERLRAFACLTRGGVVHRRPTTQHWPTVCAVWAMADDCCMTVCLRAVCVCVCVCCLMSP
jgi:hypothetical protein